MHNIMAQHNMIENNAFLSNRPDLQNLILTTSISEKEIFDLLRIIDFEKTISEHTFSQKPDKDGYYRVYVKDPLSPKGRKQLRDRNLDHLKERVYRFIKMLPDSESAVTFKEAFQYAQNFEKENVSRERQYSKNNTISRNNSEYRRFFDGSTFENMPIKQITPHDIDAEVRTILKRLDLTKKGMESIRGIINLTFKRALYKGWITENPAAGIIWKDYKPLLRESTAITKRAYSDQELHDMYDYIIKRQKDDPSYIPSYALEFQMIVGMRRGEIAPLRWEDIDFQNRTIYIHQEQISQQNKQEKSEHICNYTKNGKARYYPIAEMEMDFLLKLKRVHDEFDLNSPFLFPAKTPNGCITNNTVYQFFRRMCEAIGIPISSDCIRGTHAFRRHTITEVVNNSNGNCILAAQVYGNSPETIRKYYYTGADMDEMRAILDKRKPWSDKTTSIS